MKKKGKGDSLAARTVELRKLLEAVAGLVYELEYAASSVATDVDTFLDDLSEFEISEPHRYVA